MSEERGASEEREVIEPEQIRAVRLGHGANCSSVGSVVDTLFVSAAAAGAIFAAICAALSEEPIRVVGTNGSDDANDANARSNDERETE